MNGCIMLCNVFLNINLPGILWKSQFVHDVLFQHIVRFGLLIFCSGILHLFSQGRMTFNHPLSIKSLFDFGIMII